MGKTSHPFSCHALEKIQLEVVAECLKERTVSELRERTRKERVDEQAEIEKQKAEILNRADTMDSEGRVIYAKPLSDSESDNVSVPERGKPVQSQNSISSSSSSTFDYDAYMDV